MRDGFDEVDPAPTEETGFNDNYYEELQRERDDLIEEQALKIDDSRNVKISRGLDEIQSTFGFRENDTRSTEWVDEDMHYGGTDLGVVKTKGRIALLGRINTYFENREFRARDHDAVKVLRSYLALSHGNGVRASLNSSPGREIMEGVSLLRGGAVPNTYMTLRFNGIDVREMKVTNGVTKVIGGETTSGGRFNDKGAGAANNLAKTLYDLGNKLGGLLAPVVSLLSAVVSMAAKGAIWLESNLWVLIVALAMAVLNNWNKT